MNARVLNKLKTKLYGLYLLLAVFIFAGVLSSRRFVSRQPAEQVAESAAGIILVFFSIMVLIFWFTSFRFKDVDPAENREGGAAVILWERMIRFPLELFGVFLIGSLLITQLHRFTVTGLPPWPAPAFIEYVKGTLFDATTVMSFAAMLYIGARWTIRPHIRQLHVDMPDDRMFRSLTRTLVLLAGTGLFYMQPRIIWYVYISRESGRAVQPSVLAVIIAVVCVVTLVIVCLMAVYLFRDMERMTQRLRELAAVDRARLLSRLPVVSPYETGKLTKAFNLLQSRFEREYARINQEMELALQVQQQLLEGKPPELGDWRLSVKAGPSTDVGGGFYDVIQLKNGTFAMIAGEVTGTGLPSALVMSSVLMLMRTQIQDDTSPGRVLSNLNQTLYGIVSDETKVHIAIGIVDGRGERLVWASAGGMTIEVEQTNRCSDTPIRPLIGEQPDSLYEDRWIPLEQRCRIFIFSPGLHANGNFGSIAAERDKGA